MPHDNDQFDSFIHSTYLEALAQNPSFRRLSLYWVPNPGQNRLSMGHTETESPRYFAVALLDSDEEEVATSKMPGQVFEYKLRRAFGDAETEF